MTDLSLLFTWTPNRLASQRRYLDNACRPPLHREYSFPRFKRFGNGDVVLFLGSAVESRQTLEAPARRPTVGASTFSD